MSERINPSKKIEVTDSVILDNIDPEQMLVRGVADCPRHGGGVYYERVEKGENLFVCAMCLKRGGNGKNKKDRLPFQGLMGK